MQTNCQFSLHNFLKNNIFSEEKHNTFVKQV